MLTEFKLLEEVKNVAAQVMHLSHAVEESNSHLKILNANIKSASDSSDRNARAMTYLTFALVFVGVVQVGVAGYFSYQQIHLEQIGKEPILQIYFDKVTFDKSWNFSAQMHFRNVGSVPIYNVMYGVSDFNAAISRTPNIPATFFNVIHQFNYGIPGVIAPGEEIVQAVGIAKLTRQTGVPDGLPDIWVGATFSRYPESSVKCVELNYVPLLEYQKSSNPASECGPWWPEHENHYKYNDTGEFVPTQ